MSQRNSKLWLDRVGEVFRELTVVEHIGNGKVLCKYSCGVECIKRYYDMKQGRVVSCGHINDSRKLGNLVGERYGKLTAIEELDIENSQRYYLFLCDCGNKIKRMIKEARRGKLMSCGCEIIEGVKKANITHGMTGSKIYNAYRSMIKRCNNKNHRSYQRYGGRGIHVCDMWSGDGGFEKFYKWSLENNYSENLSIDRIDNDGNYEPDNCRWVDMKTQANNRSNNLLYTYQNKSQTLAEWADELHLVYDSLWTRMNKYNYDFEKAVTYKINKIQSKT